MALELISRLLGDGGANLNDQLKKGVVELQGLSFALVPGAAANTTMAVSPIRTEDTIVAAIVATDAAAAALANDLPNITINDLRATGTITVAAVAVDDAVTVAGNIYTFKDVPTSALHVRRVAGNDATNASRLAAAINAYETRRTNSNFRVATVIATAVGAVVTIRAVVEGVAGNAFTFSSTTGVRLAVTGAGTLTGGSATGGIRSTTVLTGKTIILVYFNKK